MRRLPVILAAICLTLAGGPVHAAPTVLNIGLLIPSAGPLRSEGIAVRNGVRMAVDDAGARGRYRFMLLVRPDNDPWGAGTQEMVRLAFDDRVYGLIGGLDSRSAHLAEQVAVKSQVIFLTLNAGDPTLTTAGVPWAFRCAPPLGRAVSISPEFRARYRRRFGLDPPAAAALAYDAATLLEHALIDTHATRNPLTLARAIDALPHPGVTGPIVFDQHGNRRW